MKLIWCTSTNRLSDGLVMNTGEWANLPTILQTSQDEGAVGHQNSSLKLLSKRICRLVGGMLSRKITS